MEEVIIGTVQKIKNDLQRYQKTYKFVVYKSFLDLFQDGKVSKKKLAKKFSDFYLKLKKNNLAIEDGQVKNIIDSDQNRYVEKIVYFIDNMPLEHIKYLKTRNNYIRLDDDLEELSQKNIIELKGFINRKIIEYYLDKVGEKGITKIINNNVLILRKKIDQSIFKYGWTIPIERHELIYSLNGETLSRGDSKEITVSIKGEYFKSKLRSVNRKTKSDTLQIRYDSNDKFKNYLKNIFQNSWEILSKSKNKKLNKISEYILLLYNGEPYSYRIIPLIKEESLRQKFWWVNQGKTYKQGIDNECIWAPLKNKNGKTFFHWGNVSKVKADDIILHYRNGKISGFSIAKSDAYKAKKPFETDKWEKEGWKVDINYNSLDYPISLERFANEIYDKNKKYFPIASDYSVNQGYLFKLNPEDFKTIVNNLESSRDRDTLSENLNNFDISTIAEKEQNLDYLELHGDIIESGLYFSKEMICRFIASLCTKNFLILTGLSGSGKTKLAQAFVKWISSKRNQYSIVTVGSDWTNREPLLGYPNAIEENKYVKPHHDIVDLLVEASENPGSPYFLVLDEMNLSHVERYFADFLSAMESNEPIQLHEGDADDKWEADTGMEVPGEIDIPENLFIIGTVNIDETTYMFSPKVLDRANVIEFRVNEDDINGFLDNPVKPDLNFLEGKGKSMAKNFVKKARMAIHYSDEEARLKNILIEFFNNLQEVGAEFGYRTASEIMSLAGNISKLTKEDDEVWSIGEIADAAIMQKLLPKLHGSRKKLGPVLENLAELCIDHENEINIQKVLTQENKLEADYVKYPNSLEKIIRMHKRLMQNGFTSFTEA
ncbi:MAG: hypothetical protein K9M80_03940 [Candidatus Marinimicrobia bacterium]|nr:hypothetical protein [Candidatus Neomarinimicrobiota bacterium]